MVGPSIIPEKLVPPSLPGVFLRRPRLGDLWKERAAARVLCVTAGAGYGKSSFLADAATRAGRRVMWYRADAGDQDLASFGAHLVRLVCGHEDPPAHAGTRVSVHGLLGVAVAALRSGDPAVLIIDDAHLLSDHTMALQVLEGLESYLPDRCTLVLSAREPLKIGGARARAAGRAAVIDARDLAFNVEETQALFALRFPGASLSRGEATRIQKATEGWAAGLEMLFQTIQVPVPAAIDQALDRFGAAGAAWFDYLAEEVLSLLDGATRDFLVRSSVLPRCEPETCDRLLGKRGSRRVLDDLVRRGLFTLREGGSVPAYRYHHLFHRFLRSRLDVVESGEGLTRLRGRAVRELLRAGDPASALELAAEMGDASRAASILTRHGVALLRGGRRESVERGLAVANAERRAESPPLLYLQARLDDDLGLWDRAARGYRRALRLSPSATLRAEVLGRLGALLARRGDYARAAACCKRGLAGRSRGDAEAEGRLLWTLGVAACELGDLIEGERRLGQARAHFLRHGDRTGEAQVDYILAANVYLSRGEFELGRDTARRALTALQREGDPRRMCQCLSVLAWLAVLAGDVGEARYAAAEARRSAEALDFPQTVMLALHVLGRCAFLEGDLGQARAHLAESMRLGDLFEDSDPRILSRLLLGECALRDGDAVVARRLGGEALALAREAKDLLQEAQSRVLLGLAAGGDARGGRRRRSEWATAERMLRKIGAWYDLHRLLLLRLSEEQQTEGARRRMSRDLLAGTARLHHDALFLVAEAERAPSVLVAALADGIEEERAGSLLARLGSRAVQDLMALAETEDEAVRVRAVSLLAEVRGARARAGLERLARGEPGQPSTERARAELSRVPSAPLRITTLGEFRVAVGKDEIPADRWRSGRARRLFQFLLVRRFRWVDGDDLIEALWPEGDPEKSRANLWQSVFQLRRVLEPELDRRQESRYVRVEESRYRLEPGDGHWLDAVEFEQLVRDGDRMLTADRVRAAEGSYRKALALYHGEFLGDAARDEFTLPLRERLGELRVHAIERLTGLAARGRRWADVVPLCRTALRDDPYREAMHVHLVTALHHLGHRREALEAYREYESRVVQELGLLRSPRMEELAERVRAGK